MPQGNESNASNVNLGLNFLTIDDVIRRAALNSGVSLEKVEEDFGSIQRLYGGKVFGGKVVLVRPDFNVELVTDKDRKLIKNANGEYEIADPERIEASVPTIRMFSDF